MIITPSIRSDIGAAYDDALYGMDKLRGDGAKELTVEGEARSLPMPLENGQAKELEKLFRISRKIPAKGAVTRKTVASERTDGEMMVRREKKRAG